VHDSTQVEVLLEGHSCENILADKAYDSDAIRSYIEYMGVNPIIPGKKNRIENIDYDKHVYKERHLIENFFQFIKRFRRIGTRYEKHAANFIGMIMIGCILQWAIF
jgi:transposase